MKYGQYFWIGFSAAMGALTAYDLMRIVSGLAKVMWHNLGYI